MRSSSSPPRNAGRSALPLLLVFGFVLLSAGFFVLFTLPKLQKGPGPQQPSATNPVNPSNNPPQNANPIAQGKPPESSSQPIPENTPPPFAPEKMVFARPEAVLENLSQSLAQGNYAQAMAGFDGTVSEPRKAALQSVFGQASARTSSSAPEKIGRLGDTERWRLPVSLPSAGQALESISDPTVSTPAENTAPAAVAPATPPATPAKPNASYLEADIRLSRQEGARVKNLRFSPDLLTNVNAALAAKSLPTLDSAALADVPDPLSISGEFLQDLLGRQFLAARGQTDDQKLTHEKLAGLCIVFEEGGYSLVPGHGLNVTSVSDSTAWTIVRVQGGQDKQVNEFGIEMAKDTSGTWKVNALNFDKMLQNYAQSTEAGKVYYTPVIKSPSGGESLVVYFEYDRAELTPRAMRQLEIVAGLLKSDEARKMKISGHTDALGTLDYNQQLSRRRAEVVTNTLKTLGVNAAQIVEVGMGENLPLDPNSRQDGSDNPEGRSRNRRTEIYLDF